MSSEDQLPSTMRAAYIAQYNEPYALGERPVPSIGDNDILIRVRVARFCHSDYQALQGQFSTPSPLGLIPSHEPAGTVAKLGPAYSGPLRIGDRVGALNSKHACGACPGCRLRKRTTGAPDARFCDRRETAGFLHDGAFAEYTVADPDMTVRLPDELSYEQAAPLMCAGATVWGSLEKATASLCPGETVVIVGVGGLGHLGLQFAKALGFRTIGVDRREAGRQLAGEMANPDLRADLVVDSSDTGAATDAIMEFTQGEGAAAAVVCTDSVEVNRWALTVLRVGGVMGILGLPDEGWRFDADPLVFRELTIKGSYVASREATERMLGVVAEKGVRSRLTTVSFDQIPDIVVDNIPAVDDKRMPLNKRGLPGAQKQNRIRYLFRQADPLHGRNLNRRLQSLPSPRIARRHRRVDYPRTHAVDADAVLRVVDGVRPGHIDNGSLGRRVCHCAWPRHDAQLACYVDDGAPLLANPVLTGQGLLLDHVPYHCPGNQPGSSVVDPVDEVKLIRRHLVRAKRRSPDTGTLDGVIDALEPPHCFIDKGLDEALVGDVAIVSVDLHLGVDPADGVAGVGQCGLVEVREDDAGASCPHKGLGHGSADSCSFPR
ncbi:Alcohol dehydrogenase-like protein [Hapsidospora chrysogenum ATCC 11550]|uniref:Alcohol dehydrogenase-like protein n=1 Tax=Hapsidospora chrysogenum (strain ATCC 11550 / CBS 779.69 / DSM 880 / IAM 14645 / JCM 23072 / IMI 49137) TaxID=857340 RepID=A0A086T5L0_HAPC1|nr:Alcohol dehydrogenase-like protein [Hapsidospora chrysogenum ATCC 11550]